MAGKITKMNGIKRKDLCMRLPWYLLIFVQLLAEDDVLLE